MPFDRLSVFWIGIAVTLVIFFAGIGFKMSFWSRGRVRDLGGKLAERY